jgi:hypothetical protein
MRRPVMPDVICICPLEMSRKGTMFPIIAYIKKCIHGVNVFGKLFLQNIHAINNTIDPIANLYPTVCSGEKCPPTRHSCIIAKDDPHIMIIRTRYW